MSVINTQTSPMAHVGTSASPQSTDLNAMLGAATRASQGSAAVQAPIAQPMAAPIARPMSVDENTEKAKEAEAKKAAEAEAKNTLKSLLGRAKAAQQALQETRDWLTKRVKNSPNERSKAALALVEEALTQAGKTVGAIKPDDADPIGAISDAQLSFAEMEAKQRFAMSAVSDLSFINNLFNKFANSTVEGNDGKHVSFDAHLNERISALGENDSSDPQNLAKYQKAIMMFTVHTNAMTSMIKSIGDLDKGVVRDFN